MPRFPLRPHDCLSRCVVRHGHPSLLKGSHLGCWKVGLSEAEPGVPSCPQRAPGQHTSPAHPDPTAAAHPRGPRHCHQGIRGAESQAREEPSLGTLKTRLLQHVQNSLYNCHFLLQFITSMLPQNQERPKGSQVGCIKASALKTQETLKTSWPKK